MKHSLLLLFVVLGLISCNKSTDSTPASTANFVITGLKDYDLTNSSNGKVTFPISIVPSSTAKDTVYLSVSDLPRGLYYYFTPSHGSTPYTSLLTFFTDFSGEGGTVPVTITGMGTSGTRTYQINVTVPSYRGWNINGLVYNQTGVYINPGGNNQYPMIMVWGGQSNGQLIINFAKGRSLPTKTRSYIISNHSDSAADNIQIAFYDSSRQFSATGVGAPVGTFTFDTLGKFVFRCSGVEMSDGVTNKTLNCSIYQP